MCVTCCADGADSQASAGCPVREIPAAAASAMSVAHCVERREQGEENMAGEIWRGVGEKLNNGADGNTVPGSEGIGAETDLR